MRDDADYAGYVAARWPLLVRTLVLIGCPRAEAEDVAISGLARCYASYDRVREADDIDVHVYATVLDGWHRSDRDEDREALVLREVAGLSEFQVAEVLDISIGIASRPSFGQDLRGEAEGIEVRPAPYDEVVARVAEQRRRRRRTALTVVAAGALVVAGMVVWSLRPAGGPDPEPQPEVTQTDNPIALPWYGDGRLQLRNVAVELPALTQVVAAAGGAVYADDDGDLAFAGQAGKVVPLGSTPLGSPVVASDERSWVAWVDSGDDTALVVHDVVDEEEVARVEVLPGSRPIALDQNRVFFISEGRTHVWEPLTGRVDDLGSRELLDIESAVRVYGDGVRIDIVQPFFNVDFRRPGATAALAPGGTFVLSRRAGQGPFEPLVYDARSGDRLPSGLQRGELALDAAFGPDGTITYLVVTDTGQASLAVLRTCHLGTSDCTNVVPLRRAEVEPLLAH